VQSEVQSEVDEGAYQLKFCKNGRWVCVTVDDYFPCKPEDGPVYSKANGSELWVLLVEKAFAKLHGSYASIRGGFAYEAMMDLTGSPFRCMKFSDPDVKEMTDSGKLWELMNYWDDNDYLMSVSTPGEDHQTETAHRPGSGTGLVAGHAYSLMDAQQMPGGEKLVQVRNPWGSGEWNGAWCDNDSRWTQEYKDFVKLTQADDGLFWMSFEDLLEHFVSINVCMQRTATSDGLSKKPWDEERHSFSYQFSNGGIGIKDVPMYEFQMNEESDLYIAVHQTDIRCIGSPAYLDIGVTVLQKDAENPGKWKYIGSTGNSAERQNQLELLKIPVGTGYLAIPTSTGCKIEALKERAAAEGTVLPASAFSRSAVISFHSTGQMDIQKVAFDAETYEEAIELPIIAMGKVQYLTEDKSIGFITLKSGYAGMSFLGQNNDPTDAMCFTLDLEGSKNIVSHRGHLNIDTLVPPGEAKVLHHISPDDPSEGWSMNMSIGARWLDQEEYEQLKAAEEKAIEEADVNINMTA